MRKPGVKIEEMVREVQDAVESLAKTVSHDQRPALYNESRGNFYFYGPTTVQAAPQLYTQPTIPIEQREEKFWDDVKVAGNKEAYEAYLTRYPRGQYVNLAKANILRITAASSSASAKRPLQLAQVPGARFRDCPACPEMVVLPAGRFLMFNAEAYEEGKDDESENGYYISIQSFAIGKTEVTQAQWRAIMGNNPSHFKDCGDSCPVENVSWNDANKFINRLNSKTGKKYRLPSESEWEYACRAGGHNQYCGSDILDSVAWNNENSNQRTHPVAIKKSNAWGLYDMSGNVSEWTGDCYNTLTSYSMKEWPKDGSTWLSGDCSYRVNQGGSWAQIIIILNGFTRDANASATQSRWLGFRIVRDN